MDSSKDVMQLFISQYNALFMEEGDQTPKEIWVLLFDLNVYQNIFLKSTKLIFLVDFYSYDIKNI